MDHLTLEFCLTKLNLSSDDNPANHPAPTLSGSSKLWVGSFQAMASDCEILMEGLDETQASRLLSIAVKETWRIEHKFSRYVSGNIIDRINRSAGSMLELDAETASLINFSEQCYQLSDGLFDISSGVLRKVWRFDGSDAVPDDEQIHHVMQKVGWDKVSWQAPFLTLEPEMELDFGGIGKEYAVDRLVLALQSEIEALAKSDPNLKSAFVANFGGDLACSGARLDGTPWVIGVESSEHNQTSVATVSLSHGAVATSGDSRRYLQKNGIRYSHILNPLTGESIIDAPHAISVAAPNCMQAGMLSTFAMLHGAQAEEFLEAQTLEHWVQR